MRKNMLWISLTTLLLFSMLGANMMGITVAQVDDHDIAVVSVTPYPTKVGLGLGELVNVTVIIENQGTENETFTVTVYYDNLTNETKDVVNQAPNTNKTLIFTWDTTDVTVGTYSINATASIVSGETDTADNTLKRENVVNVVSSYITVLPRSTLDLTLTQGQNYTISIYTNYDGSDIWGYEFTLTYYPIVLEGVEVVNGDVITGEGGELLFTAGKFNNTEGTLSLTGAAAISSDIPPAPIASTGPGILANVTFTIVGEGESPITLGSETKLKDTDNNNIIDYLDNLDPDPTRGKFLHGSFQNVPEVIHDVTVINIDPSPTSVEKGELITINVTIGNNGTVTDAVSVKVYYGFDPSTGSPLYLIGSAPLTLENATSDTITFIWNTTDAAIGTYPITAIAELFSGLTDINPGDNTLKTDDLVEVVREQIQPLPILELLAIAAVVVVVVIVVYSVNRRRRKKPALR